MGMFCCNCGAQIKENEKFCHSCGTALKTESNRSGGTNEPQHSLQSNAQRRQDYFSEEYLIETFLNRNGRLGRLSYFKREMVLNIAQMLLFSIVGGVFLREWETMNTPCLIIESIIAVAFLYPDYCLTVRRLNDLGKSVTIANWYIVLVGIFQIKILINDQFTYSSDGRFLGLLVLGFLIYLFFTPGTNGENQYGDDPSRM